MRHRLQWFLWCCSWSPNFFNRPFCGRPCCKTRVICISCWSRWFTSTTLRSLLLSPLLPQPIILGNSLPNSCVTDGFWFSSISHFAKFTKSISDCTIFFDAFSLFIILVMQWRPAVFIVLTNWLLDRFVSYWKASQIY